MNALNVTWPEKSNIEKIGDHFLIGMNVHVKDMRLCKAGLGAPGRF
jgi:hypothetical protein